MPRKSREQIISNYLHIMIQGIKKEYIFDKEYQKKKFLKIFNEKLQDYNVNVIAYCIMDNHVHLLLHSECIQEISKLMSRVNATYAKWYNKDNERVGYVFRNRFKSEEITTYNYLYTCISYIHNNPVKAKMVYKPDNYIFSTFNDYKKQRGIFSFKLLELLNLSKNNYKKILFESKADAQFLEEYDDNDAIIQEVIDEFLLEHNIKDSKMLRYRKNLEKELVVLLRKNTNINNAKLCEILGISRTSLFRILKEDYAN